MRTCPILGPMKSNTRELRLTRLLLWKQELIKEAEVKALCAKAREILVEESNVQRVDAPVTVRLRVTIRIGNFVGLRFYGFAFFNPFRGPETLPLWI